MLTVAVQNVRCMVVNGIRCCLQAACPQHQLPKASASSNSPGGYIDLIGVSGAYSGALKAATHRIEDASSDTALAKALAEKADLERQLKVRHFCWENRVLVLFVQDVSLLYVQDVSLPDPAAAFSIKTDMHFSKN